MARNPIVLIHGYSDEGASFKVWERILEDLRALDYSGSFFWCRYSEPTSEERLGNLPRAADAYEQIIAIDPRNYAAYHLLARLYQQAGAHEADEVGDRRRTAVTVLVVLIEPEGAGAEVVRDGRMDRNDTGEDVGQP